MTAALEWWQAEVDELAAVDHGTNAGYQRCRRRPGGACGRCKAGRAEYMRQFRAYRHLGLCPPRCRCHAAERAAARTGVRRRCGWCGDLPPTRPYSWRYCTQACARLARAQGQRKEKARNERARRARQNHRTAVPA